MPMLGGLVKLPCLQNLRDVESHALVKPQVEPDSLLPNYIGIPVNSQRNRIVEKGY